MENKLLFFPFIILISVLVTYLGIPVAERSRSVLRGSHSGS